MLTITNHDRGIAALKYVYPVLSRRSGGLSIGINFNTNNACNWRCIYCQVPDLILGAAPELDFALLEQELREFLQQVVDGSFYERFQVPENNRVIKDLAISGNGEPTSVKTFAQAIRLIGELAIQFGLFPHSRYVLITNGSLIHLKSVQEGLKILNSYGGEVWFKLDSATDAGKKLINNASQSVAVGLENLRRCAELCTTKLQICMFEHADPGFSALEREALLDLLKSLKEQVTIAEVLLYTVARPSLQPEAGQLSRLAPVVLADFAEQVRALGYKVSVNS